MLFPDEFEACLNKRRGVFLKGRNVAFLILLKTQPVFQVAPEKRKTIVHIDDDANPVRRKQIEKIPRIVHFGFGIVTITNRVNSEDELKRLLKLPPLGMECGRKIID